MELLLILFLIYLLINTGVVIFRVVAVVIANNPYFALKAVGSSLAASIVGYIMKGYIPVEIALFGITGFLIYLLFLVITEN